MSKVVPHCRVVTVHTFGGDHSPGFVRNVVRAFDAEKRGKGPGPSRIDCLLYAGHTGVSTDREGTIYGFNPDTGKDPTWLVMENLKNGEGYPGIVLDDTKVFVAATTHGLSVMTFDVIIPDPRFQQFARRLDAERKRSQFLYGFPDGNGDCNCTTWLERLALPLLTGSMDEFTGLPGFARFPRRRFGECV